MIKKQDVPIELIIVDGGTQQRPLDEKILEKYMGLMRDGVKFPPVEVVFSGSEYCLWDGFHRLECAKQLGQTSITAFVQPGSQRQAVWLSFSANAQHGFPRQAGIAKKILETILTDESWSKKSLTAVAKHVGVSRQYVQKIKESLPAQDTTILPGQGKQNGVFDSKNSEKGATSLHPFRAEKIEVKSSRGRTYSQKSQEKEHKPKEPVDKVGRIIPERLREVYEQRTIIEGLIRDLDKVNSAVKKYIEQRHPVFAMLNGGRFKSDFGSLRQDLKAAVPFAVCPYCGGDPKDCTACHGFGFLNRAKYEVAPRELKT